MNTYEPKKLATILADHERWVEDANKGKRADLRGADLRGANLDGASLRGASLRGANLRGAHLDGANLDGANLRGADLSGAYLQSASLREATLHGADLRGTDLHGANLDGATGYIIGPQRTDGYRFDLRWVGEEWCVVAGCNTRKFWTTAEYREHAATYVDADKAAQTLVILDYLDAIAALDDHSRGEKR